jgi:hypothetical protein
MVATTIVSSYDKTYILLQKNCLHSNSQSTGKLENFETVVSSNHVSVKRDGRTFGQCLLTCMPELICSSALAQMELVSVCHPSLDWSDISLQTIVRIPQVIFRCQCIIYEPLFVYISNSLSLTLLKVYLL